MKIKIQLANYYTYNLIFRLIFWPKILKVQNTEQNFLTLTVRFEVRLKSAIPGRNASHRFLLILTGLQPIPGIYENGMKLILKLWVDILTMYSLTQLLLIR